MSQIFLYQIFYDADTYKKLDLGFIPLDNSINSRPDWFEFWPILNFLRSNVLTEGAWYGFFSPKFNEKTGQNASKINAILDKYDTAANVALFSPTWDLNAYFINQFEQGEIWHPGISNLTQTFLDAIHFDLNIETLVTHHTTSTFANYIVAKPNFWHMWQELAEQFYSYCELAENNVGETETSYGQALYPMKTFIQERFQSILMSSGKFKVLSPDQSQSSPLFLPLFDNNPTTRRMLQTLDLLKNRYCETKDSSYLDMFYKIRKNINCKLPTPLLESLNTTTPYKLKSRA